MFRRLSPLAIVSLCLFGCGGSGSKSKTAEPLTVRGSSDYNGGSSALSGSTFAVDSDGKLSVSLSGGLSGLLIQTPTVAPSQSRSFAVGASGTRAMFALAGNGFVWRATTGSFTVTRAANGSMSVRAADVQFEKESAATMNGARGSFVLNGDLALVPVMPAETSIVFSDASGTNANLDTIGPDSLVQHGTLLPAQTAVIPISNPSRMLILTTGSEVSSGQSVDVSAPNGSFGLLYLEVDTGEFETKVWSARAGTVSVLAQEGTRLAVKLDNVRFTARGSISDLSTGSFTANGVFAKR